MRTFFDSTQSQESKSEVCAKEFSAAMHIKTPLANALYLSLAVSFPPYPSFLTPPPPNSAFRPCHNRNFNWLILNLTRAIGAIQSKKGLEFS